MTQPQQREGKRVDFPIGSAPALAGLMELLIHLKIIESPAENQNTIPVPQSDAPASVSHQDTQEIADKSLSASSLSAVFVPNLVTLSVKNPANSALPISPEVIPESLPLLEQNKSLSTGEDGKNSAQDLDQWAGETAAFETLRDLLIGSDLEQLQPLLQQVQRQLDGLEQQIYEPTQLIQLLLPSIAELLSRKVIESRDEVVAAIAPIVDRLIVDRAQQDKSAMSAALAPLISAAIARQHAISPVEIAHALAPMMGKAIQQQIRLERDAMVDALYPVIGSTIAKYMAEVVQSINRQIEITLSFKGIQRKLRAKVQGVSEAELILKEAMPFTVQAIFLIHKASGLVISERQRSIDQLLDADMIAGMLTAIRSFANDCIMPSGMISELHQAELHQAELHQAKLHQAELHQIDYDNSKIILEVAGYCYLAGVVRGHPPAPFIEKMRQTLATLVQRYSETIEQFEGDPATVPLPVTQLLTELSDCVTEPADKPSKPTALLIGSVVILSAILLPWGVLQWRDRIERQIAATATSALATTPELVLYHLTATANGDRLTLSGRVPNPLLRQKAEQVVQAAVPNRLLQNDILAIEVPSDPILAAAEVKRITILFNQMPGTQISAQYADRQVWVQGSVDQANTAKTVVQAFSRIPGVQVVSSTVQVQPPRIDIRFYFDVGSAQMVPADLGYKLQQIIAFLTVHPEQNLKIIGYSDQGSSPEENQALALSRASAVREALINQGIHPARLQEVGSIERPADVSVEQPLWLSRCVAVAPFNYE